MSEIMRRGPETADAGGAAAGEGVTVENIVKKFHAKNGGVTALEGISFTVQRGEIFGIIGPDGAGKTSLFRILTTLLLADSGHARVNGYDLIKDYKKIRQCVGYMPGRFSLYQDLSVQENLEFFAAIFDADIQKNYGLIKEIYSQIEPFKTRKAGQLSGGMKQKLALSCALIHQPSVLFLDEPTTGVDAVSRKEFWEMLHRLKEQGITILVSTSYMDEAGLCDRVALMQKGKLLSINTPAGIRGEFRKPLWAVRATEMFRLMNELKALPSVESCYPFGQYHHVVFRVAGERPGAIPGDEGALSRGGGQEILEELLRAGSYHQGEVKSIAPNIEDCFMALMNE